MKKRGRSIFDEIRDGIADMAADREGKITLRRAKIPKPVSLNVDAKRIHEIRERLNVSRGVFARILHINERTLEKWEQGRAKPNNQAAALILLAAKYPDTLDRLKELS